jgi:hypothetical protein
VRFAPLRISRSASWRWCCSPPALPATRCGGSPTRHSICATKAKTAIVAWFLGKAAVEYDPHDAVGLDGALARLAAEPYGKLLLGITAAGVLAYGVYCLFEARYRDLEA